MVPGNSPAGLRLPLDSIEFTAPKDERLKFENDLFAEVGALAKIRPSKRPKLDPINSKRIFKTTLVVEVREGKLFVFMPPGY